MADAADGARITTGRDTGVVLTRRHGHVLLITLNRPEARNAVNLAVTLGLGDALEEAERDREIWVVVLTGGGDKAFCAGADLKAVARGESLIPEDPERAAAALEMAATITEGAPLAVQASKRVANGIRGGRVPAEAGFWELSRAESVALRQTADAAEGPRAFAEKRTPNWAAR
jgi:enoyl-CoA hydratase/carnithine racemase